MRIAPSRVYRLQGLGEVARQLVALADAEERVDDQGGAVERRGEVRAPGQDAHALEQVGVDRRLAEPFAAVEPDRHVARAGRLQRLGGHQAVAPVLARPHQDQRRRVVRARQGRQRRLGDRAPGPAHQLRHSRAPAAEGETTVELKLLRHPNIAIAAGDVHPPLSRRDIALHPPFRGKAPPRHPPAARVAAGRLSAGA